MKLVVPIAGIFFSIISCAILSYVSIATTIGPWIAPTIVLSTIFISKILSKFSRNHISTQEVIEIQTIGAGGGIIATGIGFALPMIYFLDTTTFNSWIVDPLYFLGLVGAICISGGILGLYIGKKLAPTLVDKNKLPFPVSRLTFDVATTNQHKQTQTLFGGITCTLLLLILRDGIGKWNGILPKMIYLFPSIFKHELAITIMPMFWAIGATMGRSVILPLIIGVASKYFILYPINNHAKYLPITLFQPHQEIGLIFAFCSGILICEIIYLLPTPNIIQEKVKAVFCQFAHKINIWITTSINKQKKTPQLKIGSHKASKIIKYCESVLALLFPLLLFSYFKFSILAQLTFLFFSSIATYQICRISGEIGLLHFGRFNTLVMLPMYFLFNLNFIQITILCVFFNVCAATASDFLFDYKTGLMSGLSKKRIYNNQILGLLIAALVIGLFFWLLFTNFKLGSPNLFAQRAQNNVALLLTVEWEPIIVFLGFLFGLALKKTGISPTMTFSGLIMPNCLTFSLLIGSIASMFFQNKSTQQFFSAGVFSSESLWIFACIIGKILK